MAADNLLDRIRRVVPHALEGLAGFDADDVAHVDHVAGHLLDRLRGSDDRHAFELLVELTQDRLSAAAARITREIGLVKDPDDLVAACFARLLVDLRREPLGPRSFLAWMTTRLRAEGDAWVRDLACMDLPATDDASAAAANQESIIKTCFHRLDPLHRQILRAGDVEALPLEEIAQAFSLTREEVRHLLSEARFELTRLILEGTGARPQPGRPATQGDWSGAYAVDCSRPTEKTLADILYEMAAVSLGANTRYECADRQRFYVKREDVATLFHKAQIVASELLVDLRFIANLPSRKPRSSEAIDWALHCIECSEFFFGPSTSTRFLRVKVAMHTGNLGQAFEMSSALLRDPHPAAWSRFIHGQQLAILGRLSRIQERLRDGMAAADLYPGDCVILYNLLGAYTEVGDRQGWAQCCARLTPPRSGDLGYWARMVALDAGWMAERLGITQVEVFRALGPLYRAQATG